MFSDLYLYKICYMLYQNMFILANGRDKGAGSFHIHRKTVKDFGALAVLGRDARGSLFLLRGGAEEKHFGAERGGPGRKCSGRGGVTVKPRGIFGVGRGILENFWGRGALGQPFPPGSGQGGAGPASLISTYSTSTVSS